MARKVAEESIEMETPNYVRLERHVEPDIYSDNLDLSKGINELIKGEDAYLISTGIMSRQSLKLSKAFEKKKISLGVIDIHRIPCDEQTLIDLVKHVPCLFTLEENFLPGSLGSYILEVLSDNGLKKNVKRFGVSNGWAYRYGGREDNRAYHGIDEETLVNEIERYHKELD
jgi:transketolase C-terminal domain/subunit